MTFLEGTLKDHIFIDAELDPVFGSDETGACNPYRFGTVTFLLSSTPFLSTLADRLRKDLGFVPTAPMDEYTYETCDGNAWYDFYYGINSLGGGSGDSCIEFILAGSESPDNEEVQMIWLSEKEQDAMFRRMDEECRRKFGKTCQELLAEADRRMEQEMEA